MQAPEAAKYLYDIQEACAKLLRFGSGKSLAEYEADDLLRSAVERQFMVIGEALVQSRMKDPATTGKIRGAHHIIGFRNRLVHGYSAISNRTVWEIYERELPGLAHEIKSLLELMP